MANWYVSSDKYSLVSAWQASTAYTVGQIVKQVSPSAGLERCFRCSVAGTTGATEPTWSTSKNQTTVSGGATFIECSGQALYNGDGGGTAWAAPHKSLNNMFNSGATAFANAGDTVYVDKNDNSTFGNFIFGGTGSNPIKILCVEPASVPPTSLAVGAIQTCSGTADLGYFTLCVAYIYGLYIVQSGTGVQSVLSMASETADHNMTFEKCKFTLGSGASQILRLGNGNAISNLGTLSLNKYKDCDFIFGATGQCINLYNGMVIIEGGTIANTGSVPTTLIKQSSAEQSYPSRALCIFRGVDLSNISGTLVGLTSNKGTIVLQFENCKLNPAVTPYSGTPVGLPNVEIRFQNCDNGSSNYKFAKYNFAGSLTTETTTVRTGGASDGTTPFAYKLITKADANSVNPFELDEIVIWGDTTGSSKTATVEFCGSANLTNTQIWMDVEYLGDTGSPRSTIVSSRNAFSFGAGTNYSSSSETWGGSPATKQYMSVSFTPQKKGAIRVRIYVAKASTTVYIDPVITVT